MAVTVFGRGLAFSAIGVSDTEIDVAVGGTAILNLHSTGVSALALSAATLTPTTLNGTTISATTTMGTTLCGTTAASAANMAMTFIGGCSATLSGVPGTITICADRFLKALIGGKSYYIPALASAGSPSAI